MISALLATLLAIGERAASPVAASPLAVAIRGLDSLDLHEGLLPRELLTTIPWNVLQILSRLVMMGKLTSGAAHRSHCPSNVVVTRLLLLLGTGHVLL